MKRKKKKAVHKTSVKKEKVKKAEQKPRYVKIFAITQQASDVSDLQYGLALRGIRSRVFTSGQASLIERIDYNMKEGLTQALMLACDVVVVLGTDITDEGIKELRTANEMGRKICISNHLKQRLLNEGLPSENLSIESLSSFSNDLMGKENYSFAFKTY